jgi:hypothetical protein
MNDDRLQEHIARLEAGEPLDTVLADLPQDEADLVRMAAALQAVPYPARTESTVAVQRAQLLRAAQAQQGKTKMTSQPIPPSPAPPRWTLFAALAGVAAFALLCVFGLLSAGTFWLWNSGGLARNPFSNPFVIAPTSAPIAQAPDPQTAVLRDARGVVEVQASDGSWTSAQTGDTVKAGQRVRTGDLSSVALAFYDGSQSRLGPNTEVSVDSLDAQRTGARTILLTQHAGDTDNEVAHSDNPASRYEVATPSGTGAAKGTAFHVRVTLTQLVFFDVDEGAVAVTNVNVTVVVVAGQSTVIVFGQPPTPPMFRLSGEGEVQEITDNAWRIAGQTLVTNHNTVITGDPHIGDWVAFEGRILSDGTRFADRITLLRRALSNDFSVVGQVQAMGADAWTISGRTIRVDGSTVIDPGIVLSDTVEVTGGIATDGTFWASAIHRLQPGVIATPFTFVGAVQSISDTVWTVSGITFTVTPSTTIESGIVVSDVVRVNGNVLADGSRVATSIQRLTAPVRDFTFAGIVNSLDPWIVAGVPISTTAQTEIDDDIAVGDMVKVTGQILPDGTWLAERIDRFEDERRWRVDFTGLVSSTDPWAIGGVTITTDARTKIKGNPQVGDLARVKGDVLPDGTWLAREIRRIESRRGCVSTSVIVSQVSGNQITLFDGRTITLDNNVQVIGNVQTASVVIVQSCVGDDDHVTVISIIVIFQLEALPPTPTPAPTQTPIPLTGCTPVIIITNGQVSLPGGALLQFSTGDRIEMEVEIKDDKAEVKIMVNGQDQEVKIEVKDGKVEIKSQGGIAVVGAGTFSSVGVITIQACPGQAGLSIVVINTTTLPGDGDGKVTICHKPDHKKGGKTLVVDAPAVPAHLGHGDTLGPCSGDNDGGDDDDD